MLMNWTLAIHITAGSLGLIFGTLALYSSKGGTLHRRSGMLFVYAMLTMCLGGFLVAVFRNAAPAINVPAALLSAALVASALTTVRPPSAGVRLVNVAAMLLSLGVGITSLALAIRTFAGGGLPRGFAFPLLLFGIVGLLAAAGDIRMLRSGSSHGAARLARHLWRMCFALFVAALSFFVGQADVFPEAVRIPPLLALPGLVVLATMVYWLRRVRGGRGPTRMLDVRAPEAI